jgi:murein DD-endopeptidase MepM/ murein hydrolase activator NlpD
MRARALFIIAVVAAFAVACAFGRYYLHASATHIMTPVASKTAAALPVAVSVPAVAPLGEPLSDALARVTKKGFGLYVTPKNSPVQPERFTGYHTGVDFETTPAEQAVDVPVSAVCDGALALKEYASGYGGVAVQRCVLDSRDVTIIYGHLKLASITAKVGATLKRGDRLGVLGKGFSAETDGERKHLHLGIHLGTTIDIKGYVQTKAELAGWLDARKYLVP